MIFFLIELLSNFCALHAPSDYFDNLWHQFDSIESKHDSQFDEFIGKNILSV